MRIIYVHASLRAVRFYFDTGDEHIDVLWAQQRDIIANRKFEAQESRIEEDGSDLPNYGLTEVDQLLIATPDIADQLRGKLRENGGDIVECTITTQFDTYIGFRAFNYLHETPNSNIFRLEESPEDPTPSIQQYVSVDFARWLKANFDCRGLAFRNDETDGRYKPKYRGIQPVATDI